MQFLTSGLDLRQVEDVVEQLQKVTSLVADRVRPLAQTF
jgi:hypothetical protein